MATMAHGISAQRKVRNIQIPSKVYDVARSGAVAGGFAEGGDHLSVPRGRGRPPTIPGTMMHLRNTLGRYWRGEYSLAVSFWVVGVLGLGLVLSVLALYTIAISQRDFHPYQALAAVAPVWVISGAFALFQLVGTWRSAVRRAGSVLTWTAQTAAVGGLVAFFILLWQFGLPRLQESVGIAFGNDPKIPDYSLRLMRDASELEVAGGFKYGLTRQVQALLDANPRIRLIHLNSSGGRLGEGQKLAALIRSRGISTYTATECSSACTVAFAAGRERWLRKGAVLGYHAASFGGTDSAGTMMRALVREGVNKEFAARAAQTSSGSIWYPKLGDLTAHIVITASVDSYKFAASGRGTPKRLKDGLQDLLLSVAAFRAMHQAAPSEFARAVEDASRIYMSGVSEGELMDQIKRTRLAPFLKARLAAAANETLVEFAELLADQLDSLGHSDAEECFDYAVHGATEAIYDDLPYELTEREDALLKKIMETPGGGDTAFSRSAHSPPEAASTDHSQYCRQMASQMRQVSRLPPNQASRIAREVLVALYSR